MASSKQNPFSGFNSPNDALYSRSGGRVKSVRTSPCRLEIRPKRMVWARNKWDAGESAADEGEEYENVSTLYQPVFIGHMSHHPYEMRPFKFRDRLAADNERKREDEEVKVYWKIYLLQ